MVICRALGPKHLQTQRLVPFLYIFRCKGFLEACLKPEFKLFRLGISYYTAYVQFPVSNASETASIFLTVLLSIERYMAMHKISCPGRRRIRWSLRGFFCCHREHGPTKFKCGRTHSEGMCCRPCGILAPLSRVCSSLHDNIHATIMKVVIISIVINIPMFFSQQIVVRFPQNGTSYSGIKWKVDVTEFGNSRSYAVYTWLRTAFVQVLPLIFLCVINFYLVKFIRMANARWRALLSSQSGSMPQRGITSNLSTAIDQPSTLFENSQTNGWEPINNTVANSNVQTARRQAAQRKLTVLLVAIVCLFLAGQIPQALAFASNYQIVLRLFGKSPQSLACVPNYRLYRVITHCICLITYSANFILYATLNNHFKNELRRWMCTCLKRCMRRTGRPGSEKQDSLPIQSGPFNQARKNGFPHRDPVSADFVQLREKPGKGDLPIGPMSDILPAGVPGIPSETSSQGAVYSTSDHVWRASIAVLSKRGGRPVALASATLGRSVATTLNRSTSTTDEMHSPSVASVRQFSGSEPTSPFSLPTAATKRPRLISQASAPVYDTHPFLKQAKEDLSTASDEEIVFRVDSHCKRFWAKRRKTLTDERRQKRTRNSALTNSLWVAPVSDPKFKLQVASHVIRGEGKQPGVQETLQLALPPELSNKSWCPPFIVASMLRANLNVQKDKSPLVRNTLPIAYQETHLDNHIL